jgi:hypothetical protein
MNAKKIREYNLIIEIATLAPDDCKLPTLLAELCAIDFTTSFEMWEFMLMQNQAQLSDAKVCANIEEKPFGMFVRISETKTRQLLCESLPLQKLVYGMCATSGASHNLAFLVNLVLSNKLDNADECLRCMKSNTSIDFNEKMRVVVDSIFSTYCARNNVKVPVLNKKQVKLLLSHVEKVRGPNKALLTQRLKEL